MRRRSRGCPLLALALLAAPAGAAAPQEPTRPTPPDPVHTPPAPSLPQPQRITLENGLEVMLVRDDRAPYFHALLLLPGGWRSEPEETPGVAALTREMIRRGPHGLAPGQTDWLLDSLGLTLETGGGALPELGLTTEFRMEGPEPGMPRGLMLLGAMVRDPAFRDGDLETIRERMAAQQRRDSADPTETATRRVFELLGGAPQGRAAPPPEALARLRLDDVRRYHRTRVTPAGALLVLVAPGDPATAIELVREAFGGWSAWDEALVDPARAGEVPEDVVAAGSQPRTAHIVREGAAQALLAIGYRTAGPGDPGHPAAALLRLLLGVRLLDALTGRGWSYGVQIPMLTQPGGAVVVVRASVHPERRAEAHELILAQIRSLREAPVPDDELVSIKHRLIAARTRLGEQRSWAAGQLATEQRLGLGEGYWSRFNAAVVGLTADDLLQAARRDLDPGRLVTVVVDDGNAPADSGSTPDPGAARLQPTSASEEAHAAF